MTKSLLFFPKNVWYGNVKNFVGAHLAQLPNDEWSRDISVDRRDEKIETKFPPIPFITGWYDSIPL